jgi:hypothetical protein
MQNALFHMLALRKVQFQEGLTEEELNKIHDLYGICFPTALKNFLTTYLPVSKGFYNWRDYSSKNIELIRSVLNGPSDYIAKNADQIYWCDDWGDEPDDPQRSAGEVRRRLLQAPQLIPVYGHRYVPMGYDNPPVFSVHGCDIVVYGETLEDYFQVEFGGRCQNAVDYARIDIIPFWSDLL